MIIATKTHDDLMNFLFIILLIEVINIVMSEQ